MELTIKLLSGRSAGKEIKVPVKKFLIGRADDCHLRPHSDLVSRHHCLLLVEEGFCAVRDFGSKNGTLVNEERVVGQRELRNGDRLKIGVLEFEVELSSSVGGKKRPKVKDVKDVAQRTAASAPRTQDDDISDWLLDEDDDTGNKKTRRTDTRKTSQPPHETPSVSMSTRETSFLKSPTDETTTVKPAAATPDEPEVQQPAKEAAPRGAEAAKKLFGGKIAASSKNSPKNSHEAAADALKKLFNARKPS